jgi:hypothetical protein
MQALIRMGLWGINTLPLNIRQNHIGRRYLKYIKNKMYERLRTNRHAQRIMAVTHFTSTPPPFIFRSVPE